jgi:hypothetical protein
MKPHPYAEILHAIAEGHTEFEWRIPGYGWAKSEDPFINIKCGDQVRLAKPKCNFKTMTIEVTIPEPMWVKPEKDDPYWYFDSRGYVFKCKWDNISIDKERFQFGIWKSELEAETTCAAFRQLLRGEGK